LLSNVHAARETNVSVDTGLLAVAESAGASARYDAQDGCYRGEATYCALSTEVARVPFVDKNGVQDFVFK